MDDNAIRLAAFARIARLSKVHGRVLRWDQIAETLFVDGERVFIASKALGIFHPQQMSRGVLSIRTAVPDPKKGRTARYNDRADATREGWFEYRFQGEDPRNHHNVRLREAWEDRTPFIYFVGIAPGRYEPLWPAFVTAWDPEALSARVQVQSIDEGQLISATQPHGESMDESRVAQLGLISFAREPIEREYGTYEAKVRLHQDAFREQVLDAYDERCAVCRFPRRELLDAAHIIEDCDERGVAEVSNGLCLCRLHHGAFDRLLMGIRPDGVIELDQRLRDTRDGPTLEHGFLRFAEKRIHLPARTEDQPNATFLGERYAQFLAAG